MNEHEDLRRLASALIDGTARPADADRLSDLLRDHPELRDAYLGYLDTNAALCWHFRNQQIYVNGVLARERRWGSDQIVCPGVCRIGNWLPDPKDKFPLRAFRGQIDELAVWGWPLSHSELKRLVDAGRPAGLVWNEK